MSVGVEARFENAAARMNIQCILKSSMHSCVVGRNSLHNWIFSGKSLVYAGKRVIISLSRAEPNLLAESTTSLRFSGARMRISNRTLDVKCYKRSGL
jgi:hypothetical protein